MLETPDSSRGSEGERTLIRDPNRTVTATIYFSLSLLGLLPLGSVVAGQWSVLSLVAGVFGLAFLMLGIRALRSRITMSELGVTGYSDSYTHRVGWGEIAEITTQPRPGTSVTVVTALLTSGKRVALMNLTAAKRPLANDMLRELQREVAIRSETATGLDPIIRRSGLSIALRALGILAIALGGGLATLVAVLMIANDPCHPGGCGSDAGAPSSVRETTALFVLVVTAFMILGGTIWAGIRLSTGKGAIRIMGLLCCALVVIVMIGLGVVNH
ncbi:hypothetical protein [Lysinibacter cavernae]|uniref:PH domain-containing protein n=1 Tax=Lysinibacter cavernae TaxID=1640652 RepID=A0A7X5R1C6_9MICO|nr:hypothetical protein [Lysinibacter cavernae]NIH53642.1 hypothetical protein [Lysinibacter cavernae]